MAYSWDIYKLRHRYLYMIIKAMVYIHITLVKLYLRNQGI